VYRSGSGYTRKGGSNLHPKICDAECWPLQAVAQRVQHSKFIGGEVPLQKYCSEALHSCELRSFTLRFRSMAVTSLSRECHGTGFDYFV
jgi:hypothetical protein